MCLHLGIVFLIRIDQIDVAGCQDAMRAADQRVIIESIQRPAQEAVGAILGRMIDRISAFSWLIEQRRVLRAARIHGRQQSQLLPVFRDLLDLGRAQLIRQRKIIDAIEDAFGTIVIDCQRHLHRFAFAVRH